MKQFSTTPRKTRLARCEVRGRNAEAAARRLLPFLPVKRNQALLMLELSRLRPKRRGRPRIGETAYDEMEAVCEALFHLHEGTWPSAGRSLPLRPSVVGYHELTPTALGWSRGQLFAYLAGIMDSDGSFRVEKRRVRGMLGPQYRINIRCAQVVPSPAVDLLAKAFGGRLARKKARWPSGRNLVSWSIFDRKAIPAIEALLPYLRVKNTQAHLLLELRGLKARGKMGLTEWVHPNRWQRPVKMRKRCYAPEQVAEFERLHRAVQALHSGRAVEAFPRLLEEPM